MEIFDIVAYGIGIVGAILVVVWLIRRKPPKTEE